MEIFIETERLFIRELLAEDAAGMFEMDSDPEVHRYVGSKHLTNIDESRDVIDFVRKQYVADGIGRWAIIEKATNEFVGWTGFKLMREKVNGHVNHYDFGYRLMRRKWGFGFATESGAAALLYGLETLKLAPVFAMTDVDNTASRRVLEKLGFRLAEIFHYDGAPTWRMDGQPTTWYEHHPAILEAV